MKNTDEQDAVINHIANMGNKALIIEAFAGAAKTHTLIESMKADPIKSVYLVFSKEMQKEASKKCPGTTNVRTSHSLSLEVCKKFFGNRKRDFVSVPSRWNKGKFREIIEAIPEFSIPTDKKKAAKMFEVHQAMKRLWSMTMATMTDPNDVSAMRALVGRFNLQFEGDMESVAVSAIPQIMETCLETAGEKITFEEMIYYCATLNVDMPRFERIYLDEAQDFNACQIAMFKKMKTPDNSLVAVGDRYQSIMGFAGAESDSMDQIKSAFNADSLPLSVNFRCGKSIIEDAQIIVPGIRAWDQSPQGKVERRDMIDVSEMADEGMAVCRFNAPLVSPALKMLKSGRPASIKGKDLAGEISYRIKKLVTDKKVTMPSLRSKAVDKMESEISAAERRENPSASQISRITDSWEVILSLLDGCDRVEDIDDTIRDLFKAKGGMVFSSAHRSKGLEAESVYILNSDKIRMSRDGMSKEDHQQEANLDYVARTRAKNLLVKVRS